LLYRKAFVFRLQDCAPTEHDLGITLIDLLQSVLVIASFFGVIYAPFHYLDQFASPEAREKARTAIRAGQSNTDTKPLASLLEAFFGPKHLTVRCFALSSVMSLVFTFLFLGMVNAYVLDLAPYLENHRVRMEAAEEKLQEAYKALDTAYDILISALEKTDSPEARRHLEELKTKKEELDALRKTPFTTGTRLLLWMMLSVAISMNLLCDYVSLGKTRIILRQISKTESRFLIGTYLLLDLILAVIIWIIAIAIFLLINRQSFLSWSKETPTLVIVVGMVSFASTVATSIWIYTFLTGSFVSTYLRRFIGLLLRGATSLIDPEEHTFKVIGIVGSVGMVVLLAVAFFIFKLVG
jgi:hypothetical protein